MFKSYSIFLSLALSVLLFISFSQQAEDKPDAPFSDALPQVIRSVNLDQEYSFAGETMPSENFDAVERLDRELSVNSYWHSSTLLNIKSTGRYFPVIEPILAEHGVPDDFKYLAVIESNLRNVTSPSGAKGIWQFLKSTGQHYGLEVNSEVDERYHLEKATHAACRMLKDYYSEFGSWTLAAAGYNMGETRLRKQLASQKAKTYYDLNLNQETSRYIFRILAVKEIYQDPQAFGFYLEDKDFYTPLIESNTITVDGSVASWGDFAVDNGTCLLYTSDAADD